MRCGSLARSGRGFTLIEVCLAVGIFAFAIVGILGLFPVAMESSREAQALTYVPQISQSILADLRATPFEKALLKTSKSGKVNVNLSTASPSTDYYILYDKEGVPMKDLTAVDYDTGNRDKDAAYIAKVSFRPNSAGLAYAIVSVEFPAGAMAKSRTPNVFGTLIAKGD